MEVKQVLSLDKAFSEIHDSRVNRTKLHKLQDIIIIAICAVICGAESWEDVEQFGKDKIDWLKSVLDLPNGIPSHDTFNRVFARINPQEFEQSFFDWVNSLTEHIHGVIAVDGKTLRRSHDKKNSIKPLHMVSAWASESRLVLAQLAADKKSNEITAIPQLLQMLDLHGCIVTIDAMGLQKKLFSRLPSKTVTMLLHSKESENTL